MLTGEFNLPLVQATASFAAHYNISVEPVTMVKAKPPLMLTVCTYANRAVQL